MNHDVLAPADGTHTPEREVLLGVRPSVLSAPTEHALISAALCAFVTAAALFRSQVVAAQFDLMASILRVVAVAFWVRTLIALVAVARVWRSDRHARSARLELTADALTLEHHGVTQRVARHDILGIALREPLPSRTLPAREPAAWLVLRPHAAKPAKLTIPPYFAPRTAILVARLQRWRQREPTHASEPAQTPRADDDPEAHYRRAAGGQPAPQDVVIPEGRDYLLRAPFSALLGLLLALDVLRSAGAWREALVQPASAAALLSVAVLAAWLVWMQRRRASRLGVGMILTPYELLVRGPHGVVAVPWSQLVEIEVATQRHWSPFVGPFAIRVLRLTTHDRQNLLFDAAFLGVPVEVVAEFCRSFSTDTPRPTSAPHSTEPLPV